MSIPAVRGSIHLFLLTFISLYQFTVLNYEIRKRGTTTKTVTLNTFMSSASSLGATLVFRNSSTCCSVCFRSWNINQWRRVNLNHLGSENDEVWVILCRYGIKSVTLEKCQRFTSANRSFLLANWTRAAEPRICNIVSIWQRYSRTLSLKFHIIKLILNERSLKKLICEGLNQPLKMPKHPILQLQQLQG